MLCKVVTKIVVVCTRTHAHRVEGAAVRRPKLKLSEGLRGSGPIPLEPGLTVRFRLREFAPQPRCGLYGACNYPPMFLPLSQQAAMLCALVIMSILLEGLSRSALP